LTVDFKKSRKMATTHKNSKKKKRKKGKGKSSSSSSRVLNKCIFIILSFGLFCEERLF
tara:strand:+ start:261 stop:434 length:174 start_codon:yes stop_codon:yes gene_type:complete